MRFSFFLVFVLAWPIIGYGADGPISDAPDHAGVSVAAPDLQPAELIARVPGAAPNQAAAAAIRDGELLLLYLDEESRVTFRSPDDEYHIDDDVPRQGGRHLGLFVLPEGTYATWWQKQERGAKHLYVRRMDRDESGDLEPTMRVNSAEGVLPTYDLTSDGEGRMAIVYHDERVYRYGVYINVSHDAGQTWLEEDVRLDVAPEDGAPFAIEPFIGFAGEQLWVVWRERAGASGPTRLMARVSDDGGLSWNEPEVLDEFDSLFFTSDVFRVVNEQPVILGYHVGRGGFHGHRLADGGWEAIEPLPGTSGEEVNEVSMTTAVAHGDELVVAFTKQRTGRNELNRPFPYTVWAARLDVANGVWLGEPVRLDTGKEPDLTLAWSPALGITDSGVLVAAWEDRRDIRANIYLSRSLDGGVTWSDPVAAIPPGPDALASPRILTEGNEVFLFYDRFPGERRSFRSFDLLTLGADAHLLAHLADATREEIPLADREARLLERIQTLLALREEEDYAATYEFFDPVFRSRTSKEAYTESQGKIRYLESEVLTVAVTGNFGATLVRIKAEVPPVTIEGEEFEMEPREDRASLEWVWMDGDWYVVMSGTAGTRSLRY